MTYCKHGSRGIQGKFHWKIAYIGRKLNVLAHRLAQYACFANDSLIWMEETVNFVSTTIMSDFKDI